MNPKVMIILGSASDIGVADKSIKILEKLEIPYSLKVASAHRTHEKVKNLVMNGTEKGVEVFIGIAGLAAHLPGVISAYTYRPVIGVPVNANLEGLDALYACSQMPFPTPVATVGIDRGDNAAILAGEILGTYDDRIRDNLLKLRMEYQEKVVSGEVSVLNEHDGEYLDKDFLAEYNRTYPVEDITGNVDDCVDVSVVVGSYSDMNVGKEITALLDRLNISFDLKVISPVRYAEEFEEYIKSMSGVKLFVAVNGLSGLVAGSIVALSEKPVIGVPCYNQNNVPDSLLTMIQMPPGMPIATIGIDNGVNAAILAGEILGIKDKDIKDTIKWIKDKNIKL